METSAVVLNSQPGSVVGSPDLLNEPLADDRFYSEQFFADLIEQHIQTVRVARRKDEAEGTPGKRAPVPTWISDRAVRYRGKAIKEWRTSRTSLPKEAAAKAA